MSDALVPVITRAGLGALANAQGTGVQATLDAVGVGRGGLLNGVYKGYTPLNTSTALVGEMTRLPLLSGQRLDPAGLRILALLPATSAGTYPINEIGFFLSDGTLFAIWSDPNYPLSYKTDLADVELGFDLLFDSIPSGLLNITVLNPDIPDTTGVLAELLSGEIRTFIADLAQEQRMVARGIY